MATIHQLRHKLKNLELGANPKRIRKGEEENRSWVSSKFHENGSGLDDVDRMDTKTDNEVQENRVIEKERVSVIRRRVIHIKRMTNY